MSRSWLGRFRSAPGSRHALRADVRSGVVVGAESVPDSLAAGMLAGVNPVHGLYAYMVGLATGALTASSTLMAVTTTGALAVILSDVPEVQDPATSATALAVLAVLSGCLMLGLGLARMGHLVRFIPDAVLTGFVAAVAVNIVLGQLDEFTGHVPAADSRLEAAVGIVLHPGRWDLTTLSVGIATLLLIVALVRTALGPLGMLVAVVAGSVAVWLLGVEVATVGDLAAVPAALPSWTMPDFSLVGVLVVPALSLAFVALVQGAAISAAVPDPDGSRPDFSGDFRGQGAASVAAGFLQGMPVGGSMSGTALTRSTGARTARANVVAAVTMAVIVLVGADLVAAVALPSLAALLIHVGLRSLDPSRIRAVMRTGSTQAVVVTVTFVLTLVVPMQYAVLVGVGLAVVLHVVRQSNRVTVRRWVFDRPGDAPLEVDPPGGLDGGEVVVLVVHGSLFFASAPTVRAQLPEPSTASSGAVVVLRLRGTDEFGSTVLRMLTDYASDLATVGARLGLAGLGPAAMAQVTRSTLPGVVDDAWIHPATERVGESLGTAMAQARAWADDPER